MNIFIIEMKAHRKSLIFWSIGMLFMIVAGMGKFSYYVDSGQSISDLIATMPKTLRAILGFGDFDVTKASGFYGILFLYLVIMVTIHSSMLGANIIAKEESDKTAEFLMVKPVSRTKIITAKLLAALLNVVVLNLVTLILSVSIVNKYSRGEAVTGYIIALMASMFLLQLIFLMIGTGIAAWSKNPKASASMATVFLMLCFVISIVIDMNDNLEPLKYITPFKYFKAEELMYGSGFEAVFVILSLIIIGFMTWVTFNFYKKRDMKI